LEKANVIIAAIDEGNSDDIGQLVAHLRDSGRLTSVLLLRALLSRNTGLFEAALISLSCLSRKRVSGLMREWQSPAFAALYRKAGLPEALLPVFRAALEAQEKETLGLETVQAGGLSSAMITHVLQSCTRLNDPRLDKLLAVLRRFEAEAARDAARQVPAFEATAPHWEHELLSWPQAAQQRRRLLWEDEHLLIPEHARSVQQMPEWELRGGLFAIERHAPARVIEIDLAAIETELAAA
jgi:hypothetical protein